MNKEISRNPELIDATNSMLDQFDLNWEVKKLPSYVQADKTFIQSKFMGLFREDTEQVFNHVPDSYQPFQNWELAELLIRVCETTGYTIHNGGMFDGGAKVYLQLMVNEIEGFGTNKGDKIQNLATAINYHNYNGSGKWGHTSITISCANTFAAADRHLSKQNTFRHTANMRAKIDATLEELDAINQVQTMVNEGLRRMSEVSIKREHIIEVGTLITGVDMALTQQELNEKYKTVSLDRMNSFLAAVAKETKEKGGSLYGLFNGVTRFTTHDTVERVEGSRAQSKLMGTNKDLDNKAFSKLLSFAS
jgi:phage/plasmid-like protein (TIGR03299 family)